MPRLVLARHEPRIEALINYSTETLAFCSCDFCGYRRTLGLQTKQHCHRESFYIGQTSFFLIDLTGSLKRLLKEFTEFCREN